jgi:hypothetical protein
METMRCASKVLIPKQRLMHWPIHVIVGILQTEDGGDEEALGKLFMRIDANCDGTLDWDEFSNYMLLESQVRLCDGSVTQVVKV